ncbi:DUF4007 family protein [Chryseobacterium caseinilyticum]|uniref:DUF4007 family protein n=1 Tax=Chryseobacterium caseinilyticum TaxID=2771428 RepID=A0ABR8ZDU5_9FLAO|nr:DUF4007 family protein [Chryseobacterium caseinilyticum]MBD8083023.1 DUF4007 family protein [Chryseobacterium caseinilyticum]
MRFSGHDTFHCKQQWLLKGVRFIEECENVAFNDTSKAIKFLGVGKNMVSSVKYWLESFYITSSHKITPIGDFLLGLNGLDPYLEDEGTLWLLQFYLCHTGYASIFNILFTDYFKDKVSYEFTEEKVINFLRKMIEDSDLKAVSPNTLSTDFKVFIRSYLSISKDSKTLEDDFNSPLLELNLIESSEKDVFRINKTFRHIPPYIFAFAVMEIADGLNKNTLSYKLLQETIGNYFCMTNDSLEEQLQKLKETSDNFVYNEDGGMANIQIKNNNKVERDNILSRHYAQ